MVATLATVACSGEDGPSSSPATTVAGTASPVAVDADEYVATVRRTSHGVAHVVASDVGSLGFGQGYALAQDHGCTLLDQITKVRSERSAHLGPGEDDEHLRSDVAYLALGLYDDALDRWAALDDDVAALVEGYAAGVNTWLEDAATEGSGGWCDGAPWLRSITPVDLLAYHEDLAMVASGRLVLDALADAAPPGSTPADTGVAPDGDGTAASTPGTAAPTTTSAPRPTPTPTPTTGPPSSPAPSTEASALDVTTSGAAGATATAWLAPVDDGSNGWALGSGATGGPGGALVAEPHLPWEGELRLWEVQLTIPGRLDVYGAAPIGVPGVTVGFTEDLAFTPAPAAGPRATGYRLRLVPGDPTSYEVDGEVRALVPERHRVQVARPDGTLEDVERTTWRSDVGPVIELPNRSWSETEALAYRDANAGNVRWIELAWRVATADELDDVVAAHRELGGMPWSATVVATADGHAWYANGAPTPQLPAEVIADAPVGTDGLVVLDGSTSATAWQTSPGAPSPGLVPFESSPQATRDDWLVVAAGGHQLVNPEQAPGPAIAPAHGSFGRPLDPRARRSLDVVGDLVAEGDAGDPEAIGEAALDVTSVTSAMLRPEVVERCYRVGEVALAADEVPGEVGAVEQVDLSAACDVLEAWDGTFAPDAVGAVLWRELLTRFEPGAVVAGDELWRVPFRPEDPLTTPRGLARHEGPGPDPVAVHLAEAVVALRAEGHGPDVVLRELQWTDRGDGRLPIPGGTDVDGTVLQVGPSWPTSSLEPPKTPSAAPDGASDGAGDPEGEGDPEGAGDPQGAVGAGTSYVLVVAFGEDGPTARAMLAHGQSGDPASPFYVDQTYRFSDGAFRPVLFSEEDVLSDPNLVESVVRAPRNGP